MLSYNLKLLTVTLLCSLNSVLIAQTIDGKLQVGSFRNSFGVGVAAPDRVIRNSNLTHTGGLSLGVSYNRNISSGLIRVFISGNGERNKWTSGPSIQKEDLQEGSFRLGYQYVEHKGRFTPGIGLDLIYTYYKHERRFTNFWKDIQGHALGAGPTLSLSFLMTRSLALVSEIRVNVLKNKITDKSETFDGWGNKVQLSNSETGVFVVAYPIALLMINYHFTQ